jgi:hypothetical protein
MADEAARQRSRAYLRANWAQLISILRLLISEANPAPFATAPSSEPRCRIVARASAPDANLRLLDPNIKGGRRPIYTSGAIFLGIFVT